MKQWIKTVFPYYLYRFFNLIMPDTAGIPVLVYHAIGSEEESRLSAYICVSADNFEMQMEYLVEQGYYFATLDEIVKYVKSEINLPQKTVAITFDDGFQNNYKYAFPILKKRNIRATVFINTSFIGRKISSKDAFWKKERPRKKNVLWQFLSWDEIREMSDNGINFESHTHTHANITTIKKSEIENEIKKSKDIVETKLNKTVRHFCYPYGAYNKTESAILQKLEFEAAWILCTYKVKPNMDLYTLPRIGSSNTSVERFKMTMAKYGRWVLYVKKIIGR